VIVEKSPNHFSLVTAGWPFVRGAKVLRVRDAKTIHIRLLEEGDPPSIGGWPTFLADSLSHPSRKPRRMGHPLFLSTTLRKNREGWGTPCFSPPSHNPRRVGHPPHTYRSAFWRVAHLSLKRAGISHNRNRGAPPFAGCAKGGQETVTDGSCWERLRCPRDPGTAPLLRRA
jgi:hypothetical protein